MMKRHIVLFFVVTIVFSAFSATISVNKTIGRLSRIINTLIRCIADFAAYYGAFYGVIFI